MSRILVLGGSGEMGSAAVADLVERTDHEVTVGDIRPDAAASLLRRLGAPERVVRVDVDDPASLAAALAGTEVVLNATYMRQVVAVTDAAIAAGVHLVDLGAYYPETRQQLDRHEAGAARGLPHRPRLRRGAGPDQHPRAAGRGRPRPCRRDPDVLVHHPPDVDLAGDRRDPLRREHGHLGRVAGRRPRRAPVVRRRGALRLPGAVRRAGGPHRPPPRAGHAAALDRRRERRVQGRLPRRRDAAHRGPARARVRPREPFMLDGASISPRRFAASYIGSRGIAPDDRERQRQARPGRGHARWTAGGARLRLRGRAGRSVGVVGHHRDGRRDRRRPGRARRTGRRPRTRGRLRTEAVHRRARRARAHRRRTGDRRTGRS